MRIDRFVVFFSSLSHSHLITIISQSVNQSIMSSANPLIRASLRQTFRARSTRALPRTSLRFQSTQSQPAGTSHVLSGVAGGAAVLVAGYGLYSFSSAGRMHSKLNQTVKQADEYYKSATKTLREQTPEPNEAIDYLRKTAYSYAAFIPGGRGYVDSAFKDIDAIREKHSDEVDQILHETYKDLQEVSKSGLSMESVQKVAEVLQEMSKKLGSQAGDAFASIVDNHPELKKAVGGNLDQLKTLGDQLGPQAKEQVDQTWNQVQDILKGGVGVTTISKIKKLVEEKMQVIQQMGDEAWKKGLEQAKPYLDKNPKIKELVEKNQDALKQGNFKELFDTVKSVASSGNTEELEKYINSAKDKVNKATGGGLESYLKMIPGGSEILPKLSQLQEVASKHRQEGESLLKETMQEIEKVVSQQSEKAKKLADKAKEDAK